MTDYHSLLTTHQRDARGSRTHFCRVAAGRLTIWLERRSSAELGTRSAERETAPRSALRVPRWEVSPPGVEPGLRPSHGRVHPPHPEDSQYPDLDSNQGPDLRR